jgi:S1-C subfamily serine protease
MTEEEKDETTGGPVESSETDAAPIARPETTPPPPAQADLPEQPPAQPQPDTPPMGEPVQPTTPPLGVPQGAADEAESHAPTGSYAMGALAGNPMLGAPAPGAPSHGYGAGPNADPATPGWPAPPTPDAGGTHRHRRRTAVLVGGAALAALGLGVGLGHLAWGTGPSTGLNALPASGSGRLPFRTNPGNSFGNGFPFGGGSANSGGSGNSGSSGSSNSSGPSDANSIASKVDPGLVDVNTTLGLAGEQAAGTGIVLTSNGVILTNNHVIDGATSISVTDVGNGKTYSATVVGYDRTQDVAVLQLHNASGLQTATLGNSSTASAGEDVVGVGNAGGTGGTPSAAGGTITALNQSITASDEGDGTSEQLTGLIQTNADIQPGDSGGALVNDQGQVLGVDTAASAGTSFQSNEQSQGTEGFAIPINTALNLAHQIENGNASSTIHMGATAFLGVEISPSGNTSGNGNGNGFGPFGGFFGNSGNTGNSVSGAAVAGTVTNGPAQEAGLAQGDVITSLGGKSVGSANDLTNDISAYHPGDKVSVGWTDANGNSHSATVQLSSGPPQ